MQAKKLLEVFLENTNCSEIGAQSHEGQGLITAGDGHESHQRITDAMKPITDGENGEPRIASETRPVNVALYGYIKIRN